MEITSSPVSLTQADFRHYFEKGLFYTDYLNKLSAEAVSPSTHPYTHYVPLNLQRSLRIGKTARLTDEIRATLDGLQHGIKWLVISEHWCGDASQILPVMNKIAEAAMGKIELRIVYREENPDLMDAHRTGTSRSIPILIQLDDQFNVTGVWGPRPEPAQRLVMERRSNPATAAAYSEELHKWYAQDRQNTIVQELNALLALASQ